MSETLFDELKRYVGFDAVDEQALRAVHPLAVPDFQRIIEVFYQRILEHDGARKALEGGEAKVGQLKITLRPWLEKLLLGPWDEAYFQLRCRIGRVHVRIELPQHYMFGAMNVLRNELNAVIGNALKGRPDEIGPAQRSVGKVLDLELAIMLHTYREDLLTQRTRDERLATFGQLVGSIGHELRNPLGVIETSLYILKGRLGDDERSRKHVDRIGEQLGISNRIISDLMDMIRDRPLTRVPVPLQDIVDSAIASVVVPAGVTLSIEGLRALPAVMGDQGQLRQVIVNLVENAVQATGHVGTVSITGSRDASGARLVFEDSGPGIDDAVRSRLFEPLITTKDKGIGLGLALVKRIIERHAGSIGYEHRPGHGARFVVLLPLAEG